MTTSKANHGLQSDLPRSSTTRMWRCDACGQWAKTEAAMVVWDWKNGKRVDHRILHIDENCNPPDRRTGEDRYGLDVLVGPYGLAMLLSWIDSGAHDVGDVVEIIRRIHVPRYEAVAPWFKELERFHLAPTDPWVHALFQDEIRDVAQKLSERKWAQPDKPGRFLLPRRRYARARVRSQRDPES